MRFCSAVLGIVLSALMVVVAGAPQARAIPVQIDLVINFIPPDPIIPTDPIFQSLTGAALFGTVIPGSEPPFMFGLAGGGFDIGTLTAANNKFTGHFAPTEPCVGAGTCTVGFSFGGQTTALNSDGISHSLFSTFAFKLFSDAPTAIPAGPPIIPIGTFIPGDPCFVGGVCHSAGVLVAYDDPIQIGTWEVTISAATPLPGALPLFASGLGALGLLGWRRKQKALATGH